MPRAAREHSESGIYHVILKGINGQDIFEEDADKTKFLYILSDAKTECGFELYAYALMNNHVHLILREKEIPLDKIFKRIGSRYVLWFNTKYVRSGHLFQDRFMSEPIEDDEYLTTAICYIHYNPLRGGLSHDLRYEFSSYPDYLLETGDGGVSQTERLFHDLTDTTPMTKMGAKQFLDFHDVSKEQSIMEISALSGHYLTEEAAREILSKHCNINSAADFQRYPKEQQIEIIRFARDKGISIRQLNRLTGVSRSMIDRWSKTE